MQDAIIYAKQHQSYSLTPAERAFYIASIDKRTKQGVVPPPLVPPKIEGAELVARFEEQAKGRHVKLSELLLTDESILTIAADLPSAKIASLQLSGNRIGGGGALSLAGALASHSHLLVLHLGSNRIGDAGVAALGVMLGNNTHLRTLGLGYNGIGDAGIKDLARGLARNKRLNTLQLGANKIGDQGCLHIARETSTNHSATTGFG